MNASEQSVRALGELAAVCGVTTEYHDGTGEWRRADPEAIVAILAALGEPLAGVADAPDALRRREQHGPATVLEPVVCAAAGRATRVALGTQAAPHRVRAVLTLESGETHELEVYGDPAETADGAGRRRSAGPGAPVATALLPSDLADGYHDLCVESEGRQRHALVLAAPARLPAPPQRAWALFAPLYALHSSDTRELADYGVLGRFARLADRTGADYAATLPLLDVFADAPFDPSPYAPISRRFWSELYVDVRTAAEFPAACRQPPPSRPDAAAESDRRIDYRAAAAARRDCFERMLDELERVGGSRRETFENALVGDPDLGRYAEFRAAVERRRCTWPHWPTPAREGRLGPEDLDPRAVRVHAYAQWLARQQMRTASLAGARLYLDFPLGSHSEGYDTWNERDSFTLGIRVGAPPDRLFTGGQDWGFPPLHPQRQRENGYATLRAALRHHFEVAGLLRIDHVMGLHRLFWIAAGHGATEGVYVRYPAEEIWNVVAIEAARARAAVVGEDLGTVPEEVRREMDRRGALRMFVVPFELRGGDQPALPEPPPALACLGTHDTATFAAWWRDLEEFRPRLVDFLRARGLIDGPGDRHGRADSDPDRAAARQTLEALLEWLAGSDAAVLLVALDDLLLELEPQNRPGTPATSGNWTRRARASMEQMEADPQLLALLAAVEAARRSSTAATTS